MNKELKEIIENDLKRIYKLPLSFKDKHFMPLEVKHLILFRKATFYKNRKTFLYRIYSEKLIQSGHRTHISIPVGTKIGKGFYIGHLGRVIIHPDAILGDNINISTGVTIGQVNRGEKKGTPTIGNMVWIGTNAVIVGNIHVGNNVLIAPGAYVNTDIPDNSVVIGNPATIHSNNDATKDYINNTV